MDSPISLCIYDDTHREDWDECVREAKNGCFWFERRYLEYHRERFAEASMLFRNVKGQVLAVLPAHAEGDVLRSHGGLPFAGLVLSNRSTYENVVEIFGLIKRRMRECGLYQLQLTQVPEPYCSHPTGEVEFVMHKLGARCSQMRLSSMIGLDPEGIPLLMSPDRTAQIRRASVKFPLEFEEEEDPRKIWPYLERFLLKRFERPPVHSLDDMLLLKAAFPDQIRMIVAKNGNELLGGAVLFLFERVIRLQYFFRVAQNPLDYLSFRLYTHAPKREGCWRPFIDLSTSADPATGDVVATLLRSKERLGARGVCIRTWELTLEALE